MVCYVGAVCGNALGRRSTSLEAAQLCLGKCSVPFWLLRAAPSSQFSRMLAMANPLQNEVFV